MMRGGFAAVEASGKIAMCVLAHHDEASRIFRKARRSRKVYSAVSASPPMRRVSQASPIAWRERQPQCCAPRSSSIAESETLLRKTPDGAGL
jgi:hypothetical protein